MFISTIRNFLIGFFLCSLFFVLQSFSQQSVLKTCKDTPKACDKELILLRTEIEQKRTALANIWALSEDWQMKVEKLEEEVKSCEEKLPKE